MGEPVLNTAGLNAPNFFSIKEETCGPLARESSHKRIRLLQRWWKAYSAQLKRAGLSKVEILQHLAHGLSETRPTTK